MIDTDIIDETQTGDGRAAIRSRRSAIARRRPEAEACECGAPAGRRPARCDECGAAICRACAAAPGGATCYPRAVRILAECPPDLDELAQALLEVDPGGAAATIARAASTAAAGRDARRERAEIAAASVA